MANTGKYYMKAILLRSFLANTPRLQQPDKCSLETFQTPGWLKIVSIPTKIQKYQE